ncbi:MAG: leucyl/phenylalanyl-tRNA--protein transferase [Sideroxydans sp.]|nr:leucyl/phenylalanyl-tRNA--protein transferase [Sideroxydans sp.]
MIPILQPNMPLPPANRALLSPNGLVAAGGDLSPSRLIEAYRHGIFPWFGADDPILWWSPDPRMVLFPSEIHLSTSFRKTLKKKHYEVRTDSAFKQVMQACAAPRKGQEGTWITTIMIEAYCELHRRGLAHSVEVWSSQGELIGGLYGVAIGKIFFGESMFSRQADGSKIAFAHLAKQLERWNFGLIDCQMHTTHLASLGAREIPRATFLTYLNDLIDCEPISNFEFDGDLFE